MARQPLHTPRAAWPAWLVLILAAAAGAWWWWDIGRAVAIPDSPSARVSCVSYSPYRSPGQTPFNATFFTPEQIDHDLAALSQRFDCVRTYTQSQGLDAVPAIAARHGMKVLMGIWLGGVAAENEQQIRLGIATARAHPQALRGIVVGNEVLLRGELSEQALAAYIRRVREAVQVPVTYADVWEYWLRYRQLADSVDFIAVHMLPYWEDQPVPAERAVEHVAQVYARMRHEFPGRRIMIGETGWPSAGRPRQAARATLVDEVRYVRRFLAYAAKADLPYNMFAAFDEPWKRRQEGTVGGYWGLFDVDARPKFSMQGPVVEEPRWREGLAAGVAGALLFALAGLWRRRWRGGRGWAALALAGFGSGCALAWQWRKMVYGCINGWEWAVSIALLLAALYTGLRLARQVAAELAGAPPRAVRATAPAFGLRFAWMAATVFYSLLLVFDGRYRDYPIGVFALPCLGYALAAWLDRDDAPPLLEERFLAFWLPALALVGVVEEAGINAVAWLWLGLSVALAVPVALARRQSLGLGAQQA